LKTVTIPEGEGMSQHYEFWLFHAENALVCILAHSEVGAAAVVKNLAAK
jgi:hypothetical protein